jgi:glycosyltransferase involved in cell wall biosynthesis
MKTVGTIHFNALHHGMGSGVFECMAMGIPSITGNYDPTYPNLIKEMHPNHVLPFLSVTKKEDLFEAIEALILDESLRLKLAKAGMEWVEKYHSFEYTTALAIKTYQEAIELRN